MRATRRRTMGWSAAAAALTCALGLSALAGTASAQGQKFPAGKTVSIYVGTSPGGTVDATMRLVARHIGKYLPGNPTVVPRNLPGAGSRKLAAYLYNQAPKDGTEFGLILRPLATDTLLGGADNQFDVLKLTWLGTPSPVTDVCGFWHTSPVKSFEELQKTEIVIPAIGAEAGEVAQTSILHHLAGARLRTVIGYQGGGEMNLALERGEAHGRCALSWEAVKSSYPDFITERKFLPFVQFALQRHPDLPAVPTIMELAKTDLDRQALDVLLLPQSFGFPFAAPPDLDPETKALLRDALAKVLQDPAFLAEAQLRKFDVSFISGEAHEAMLKKVYAYPPAVIERAKALVVRK
jgi:tripartite-type tricarboxylate transporter receptor subunit TctC